MIKQKFFSLTELIKKAVSKNETDDTYYLEDLKKQRKDFVLKRAFENSRDYTLIGMVLLATYLIITFYNLWGDEVSSYFLVLSYFIEFVGIALLIPFYSELKFFDLYYKTYFSIKHIIYSKNKEKHDLHLENFQIRYNNLRKQMKKQIISSKGNFLTYDYETNRIVHEIDTFFDATIKILFRKKIMDIPYLPREEVEKYVEEMIKQSHLDDQKWGDIEPPDELNPDSYEIKTINFISIGDFMRIYGNFIIGNPRKKAINTIAIAELFRKWNSVVKRLEPEIFEESKKDVERYYNKKQELHTHLFSKAYEIFVIFLITILSGAVLTYFS